jgi:heterodisulfide reductase subunit A-like polyferredoxin
VEEVQGSAGSFKVTLRKTPRYIDEKRCTACGECAAVCPIALPNEYDQGLNERKAVYKKYAQAIPGAYAISKRGVSPCRAECPAHISVQGYVALVAQGKYREALELIKEENPLPAICGRVCHHPCESVCTRGKIDEPVAIDSIKRFVADLDLNAETRFIPERKEKREERVAVIGSGPAGLSCAYYLAKEGYGVTIYERLPVAGGMLSVGIPEYRLPRKTIEAEIGIIQEMGVEIRTGVEVGKDISIEQLRREGNRAIFLGLGSHECKRLGIEGEDLEGVYPGIGFLREVNLGRKTGLGRRVAVVGGGNVAMDAVRTAVRLGTEEAFVIYRRGLEEMPANPEEIEECEEEGIRIQTLTNPVRIIGEGGKVKAIECVKMTLGEPDASGRRRPVTLPGSEFILEVDAVIPAIGQESDWSCLGPECACTLTDWGTMKVDPLTLQTEDPDLFAGGDAVTGPRTVIEAIEAGKQAAISIDRYIRGLDLKEGREREWNAVEDLPVTGYDRIPRAEMPRLDPRTRLNHFQEVQTGFNEAQAVAEAKRCVACGICSECYQCVKACGAGAVSLETHERKTEWLELEAGSIVLAPGFQPFDPGRFEAYGYASHPNVITSMEFERILSASGPTMGHLLRPSDGKEPKKIAWLQCVGSRDMHACDHGYCSSVCCMYAIKEAVIAKEHAGKELDCAVFYMDMRTHGKDFEKYYEEAGKKHGVRFIRSRVPTIERVKGREDLVIPYINEKEELVQESFDLVVLSVGLEAPPDVKALARKLGVELSEGEFCRTDSFHPVRTSREGVFVCGCFQGPKDIPQSVIEASSAAAEAGGLLSEARNTLTKTKERTEERNIRGERPRIGVFVCQCGINIGGVVDVPEVRAYAASLPYVEYVADNLYTCSQDTQDAMAQVIAEKKLNRIVVAACTPKTHEPLFQETLVNAGLNKYLFEMTNIRNQDSWVHKDDPEAATRKAKDLVRMAVAKTALMEPLQETELDIDQRALVIGGGISGMVSAKSLSDQGFKVILVERSPQLGGQARNLFRTWKGEDVGEELSGLIQSVQRDRNIEVRLKTELERVEGFVGNFGTTLLSESREERVQHGIAVIATGAAEFKPEEYLYGQDPRVLTHLELDRRFMEGDPSLKEARTAVFIQCVGSREPGRPYCSRVCCTHSVESALHLKELNPEMNVYVLFRDIRTYGEREYLYREARLKGVLFIPFSLDRKPEVTSAPGGLEISVYDRLLGRDLVIRADLLSLATAILPYKDERLAQFFKIPMNEDGFFVEAHAKLGPSEFATDGVFLCGMAHYPKSIDESVAQALAASSRAVTLLARKSISVSGTVAEIHPGFCSSCGVCVTLCPYSAPSVLTEGPFTGRAKVNPALCKGCGICAASCRSGAINLKGFGTDQIMAMINEI